MELKVAKTFDRNGQRYRAGDAPPPDLDKPTVQHYLRHGMLVEAAPAGAPAGRRAAARQKQESKPAAPQNTGQAGPTETGDTGPQDSQTAAPAEGSSPTTAPDSA